MSTGSTRVAWSTTTNPAGTNTTQRWVRRCSATKRKKAVGKPSATAATPRIQRRSASSRGPAVTPTVRTNHAMGTMTATASSGRAQQHAPLGSVRGAVGEDVPDVGQQRDDRHQDGHDQHDDGTGVGIGS